VRSPGSRSAPGLPAHVATTRHLCAAYPFVAEAGLGHEGVLIGRDLLGGSFVYDPFALYRNGAVTNPNMVVIGQIGRGKSSFVKSYLWRQAVFGRSAWVIDPKGEYGPLCEAWGVTPVALRPGGPVRLNPLDTGITGPQSGPGADAASARRSALCASLAVSCLGRDLLPRERAAVEAALDAAAGAARAPTLPMVVDALLEPGAGAATELRTTRAELVEDGRDVALELRRLVHGDLRGMFDGPTTTLWSVEPDQRSYAIYTRISREDKDDKSPSPETQAKNCKAFLAQRGLKSGPVFEDRVSGSKANVVREDFDRMMDRVERGEFAGICVWKLDRLTRQMRELSPILEKVRKSGAFLMSVTDANVDTTTPIGEALLGFIIAQGAQESENTKLRVKAAEKERALEGKPHGGGHRSYGYRWVDKRLEVVAEEKKQIRWAVKNLNGGDSLRLTAAKLNERGSRTTTGRKWTHSTLKQMLESPKLRGDRIHNGQITPGNWEAILSAEEQFEVLEKTSQGNAFRSSKNRVNNRYLLTGLMFCSNCQSPMYPHRGNHGRDDWRYTCRHEGLEIKCARSIVISRTDEHVYSEAIDYSDQRQGMLDSSDTGEAQLRSVNAAIAEVLNDLGELRASKYGTQDKDERGTFDLAISQRQELLDKLRPQRASLEARVSAAQTSRWMRMSDQPWHSSDMTVRRAWLRMYIAKIWIDAAKSGGRWSKDRIRIDWLHGSHTPTDEALHHLDLDAMNLYEELKGQGYV